MATKLDEKVLKRELALSNGKSVIVTMDKDGLTFVRKGDKNKVKKAIKAPWEGDDVGSVLTSEGIGFLFDGKKSEDVSDTLEADDGSSEEE